jgi:hypothetical protein
MTIEKHFTFVLPDEADPTELCILAQKLGASFISFQRYEKHEDGGITIIDEDKNGDLTIIKEV